MLQQPWRSFLVKNTNLLPLGPPTLKMTGQNLYLERGIKMV